MRPFAQVFAGLLLAIATVAAVAAQPPAPAQGVPAPGAGAAKPDPPPSPAAVERAAQILAEARKALGGPALDAVTTVVAL